MACRGKFNIALHVLGEQKVLTGVDSRWYTRRQLLHDIDRCNLMPRGISLSMEVFYEVEGTSERIPVRSDEDVTSMFQRNKSTKEVHIWIELTVAEPLAIDSSKVLEKYVINLDASDEETGMGADFKSKAECVVDIGEGDEDSGGVGEGDISRRGSETKFDNVYDERSRDKVEVSEDVDEAAATVDEGGAANVDEGGTSKRRVDLSVGDVFENVYEFREALRDYSIQEGFELLRVKNERTRVTVRCAAQGCPWRVHASPLADGETYTIKTLKKEHTCVRVSCVKEGTSAWIAGKLVDVLRANPNMGHKCIRHHFLQKYGLEDIPYMQIYRARKKATEMIEGGGESGPEDLNDYVVSKTKCGRCGEIVHTSKTCQSGSGQRRQAKGQSRKKRRSEHSGGDNNTQDVSGIPAQVVMDNDIPLAEIHGRGQGEEQQMRVKMLRLV